MLQQNNGFANESRRSLHDRSVCEELDPNLLIPLGSKNCSNRHFFANRILGPVQGCGLREIPVSCRASTKGRKALDDKAITANLIAAGLFANRHQGRT